MNDVEATDTRPAFSPAAAVLAIQDALSAAGIPIDPAPNQLHVASLAMADCLRSLGVRPETAPMRR